MPTRRIWSGQWTTGLLLLAALTGCARDNLDDAAERAEQRRAAAQAAIAANPRAVAPQVALARLSFELGDGVAAEAAIRRAQDMGGEVDRLRPLLARAAAMQGENERALAILDSGPVHPDMADEAAHVAANIHLDLGNLDAARRALDAAIDAAPNDARLWVDVARFREASADLIGASDAVDRAIDLDDGSGAALAYKANLVRTRHGLAAALPWYEAALASDPDNVAVWLDQAATLGDLGRYTAMLVAVRHAAELSPRNVRGYYLQAVLSARAGNFLLARSLLQRTRGELDDQPGVLLLSAIVELELGSEAIAADLAEKLLGLQPDNFTARRLLAISAWAGGDSDGAAEALAPLVARSDADSWSLALAARVAAEQGKQTLAAQYLRRSASLSRGEAGVFAEDEGLTALTGAADAQPLNPAAVIAAVRAELAAGQSGSATVRALRLRDANPGVVDAQLLLGDAALADGNGSLAIRAYRDAQQIDVGERPSLRLAVALRRAGDVAGSAEVIFALLDRDPTSLAATRLAGHLAMDSGDWDKAIALFDRVRRRIGNRDAVVIDQLARAWAAKGDRSRAVRFAEQAYRLKPLNVPIIRLYADLLAEGGDGQGAADLREKAAAYTR